MYGLSPSTTYTFAVIAFDANGTRDGDAGTLTPLAYSARIGPGGQFTVGFSGGDAAAVPPTGFTVDGLPCPAA